MASLALKAIAYGADKIPDKFFESIPGGYYKDKEERERKQRKERKSGKDRRDRHDKERDKRRSHSEGKARRRSPSPSDSEHDDSDYPYTDEDDSEFERRRRRRRGRGRDRARDSDDWTKQRAREEEDLDSPPPKHDRSRSMGHAPNPYYQTPLPPPKLQIPQPVPGTAVVNPVQPGPREAGSPYKPYHPAEYSAGPMAAHDYYNVQPMPVQPMPMAATSPQNGYYSPHNQQAPGAFPVRSSRASSVDSRGHTAPYIPHANVYQPQQTYPPSAYTTATASPYSSSASHASIPAPAYVPQTSSPYNPGYIAAYAPVPHGYATQPVSRHGSISHGSHSSQPVSRNGSSAGGGGSGASRHAHRARHDRPDTHRRHSVNTQHDLADPRAPRVRNRGSSTASHGGSAGGLGSSIQHSIDSLAESCDGADERGMAKALEVGALGALAGGLVGHEAWHVHHRGSEMGSLISAAVGGIGAYEAERGVERRREKRRRTRY